MAWRLQGMYGNGEAGVRQPWDQRDWCKSCTCHLLPSVSKWTSAEPLLLSSLL